MKLLKDILPALPDAVVSGATSLPVAALCIDSRKVQEHAAFFAIKGTQSDGHEYIDAALAKGATTIFCEHLPTTLKDGIAYVQVKNAALAAGLVADTFYNHPSQHMKVVGVTGTNGKTTVATILYKLYRQLGYRCGLISTVQNHVHDAVLSATHTTPDAIAVQHLLGQMRDAACEYVFMEVSSHAIHQHRIAGILFAGGIFTNISHDHLDYHQTFDEYIKVKKAFFDGLPKQAFALTNIDDKRGEVMLQNTKALRKTYSLRSPADYKGKILENSLSGLAMNINHTEAHFRLMGTFNAYNLLAIYGAAMELGADSMEALQTLSALRGATGRFETYTSAQEEIIGIVDYAHTPDALLNALQTIKQMNKSDQQIITVVGCGGDRDKTKRPVMAQVAAEHSTRCIFTADNPRSEDPEMILNDMEAGLSLTQKRYMLRIINRREAIKTACMLAQRGDVVLIAGKGHETYQEINGVKYDFDDSLVLQETFKLLNK